eukprot:538019-Rhodomonas_salina.2
MSRQPGVGARSVQRRPAHAARRACALDPVCLERAVVAVEFAVGRRSGSLVDSAHDLVDEVRVHAARAVEDHHQPLQQPAHAQTLASGVVLSPDSWPRRAHTTRAGRFCVLCADCILQSTMRDSKQATAFLTQIVLNLRQLPLISRDAVVQVGDSYITGQLPHWNV